MEENDFMKSLNDSINDLKIQLKAKATSSKILLSVGFLIEILLVVCFYIGSKQAGEDFLKLDRDKNFVWDQMIAKYLPATGVFIIAVIGAFLLYLLYLDSKRDIKYFLAIKRQRETQLSCLQYLLETKDRPDEFTKIANAISFLTNYSEPGINLLKSKQWTNEQFLLIQQLLEKLNSERQP